MISVIIGLGSNINPESNLKKAFEFLESQFRVLKKSKVLKTDPIGMKDPHYFLNAAVLIETDLSQENLFKCLRHQESVMGRVRTKNKYTSRPIDFDILVWDREIIDKDIFKRTFLQDLIRDLNPKILENDSNALFCS